ncbi:hypothetical protein S245_056804, partial [Arachis hypogaea]
FIYNLLIQIFIEFKTKFQALFSIRNSKVTQKKIRNPNPIHFEILIVACEAVFLSARVAVVLVAARIDVVLVAARISSSLLLKLCSSLLASPSCSSLS